MPTFPTVFGDARCMNGQHAVALLADAWRKGIHGFDLERAYACMKKTMRETRGSSNGVRLGELTSRTFSDAVDAPRTSAVSAPRWRSTSRALP